MIYPLYLLLSYCSTQEPKNVFSLGLCNKKQKEISKTIKRAQVLGKYRYAFLGVW